ncbi:MAG: hypothetical protein M0R03_16330 [Novosphingobium sp.]|nr:hypothetical protein [Novosphingobium sp.]
MIYLEMKTKTCTKCKIPLPVTNFTNHIQNKDSLDCWCKICKNGHMEEYRQKYPWRRTLDSIKQRCNNSNNKRYKYYGGRGIKCLITAKELKKLWNRDKAYLMDKPSIDREENDGHYEYSNCRFIEKGENSAKDKRKSVLQYDLKGRFIKEWISQSEAHRYLKIDISSISQCCSGKRKTAGGFIWVIQNQ